MILAWMINLIARAFIGFIAKRESAVLRTHQLLELSQPICHRQHTESPTCYLLLVLLQVDLLESSNQQVSLPCCRCSYSRSSSLTGLSRCAAEQLFSAGQDSRVQVYDLRKKAHVHTFDKHQGAVSHLLIYQSPACFTDPLTNLTARRSLP